MSGPIVSIVIATRNRPDDLGRALASVSRQRFAQYEVLVVDDGSSARLAEKAGRVVDGCGQRFRRLQPLQPGESGSGPAASRNRGIHVAAGRYVAFLDDDDTWTDPGYLETAVQTLDAAGADFFCAEMQAFRGEELVYDRWFPELPALTSGSTVLADPPVHRCSLAAIASAGAERCPHPNTIVVRRRLITEAGGFLERLWFGEDREFALRLLDRAEGILYSPRPVARYRLPESGSHSMAVDFRQQHLQDLAAAQHLRMVARSPEVQRVARRMEAWHLRQLAVLLRRDRRRWAALSLSLQAIVSGPSAGAVVDAIRALLPSGKSEG
jgi:glycosyltransferase involved in cell wall biosynthesis